MRARSSTTDLLSMLNTHFPEKNEELIETMANTNQQSQSSADASQAIESELEQLQSLLDQNLIAKEEYNQK